MDYATFAEANAARQVEWLGGVTLPLTFRTNELAGELGEVAELLLDRWTPRSRFYEQWFDSLAEEISDVVICVEIIAWQMGWTIDYPTHSALASKVGNDHRWCAVMMRDVGMLCNTAKKHDRLVLGIPGGEEAPAMMRTSVGKVVGHAYDLAFSEGIDLDLALARKFNKTSNKVGLKTLYIPPGYARALLIPTGDTHG